MASAAKVPPGLDHALKAKGQGKPHVLGPPPPPASAEDAARRPRDLGFGHGRPRRLVRMRGG